MTDYPWIVKRWGQDAYQDAVSAIVECYELSRRKAKMLKADGYLELSLGHDGNEYVEIIGPCGERDCTS